MTIEVTSRCEAETLDLAAALGRGLEGGAVIGLEGELGSGKTCFVRGLAAGLGLDSAMVCSPTFVICKRYSKGARSMVHVDAFRLDGPQDLEAIGWDELLEETGTVIAVEWAGRIAAAMPPGHLSLEIDHVAERSRRLRLTAPPELARIWERRGG